MVGLDDNVLITGGAGFLGRGIMRRARRDKWPAKFTIYSRNEQNQHACMRAFPEARYVLGDVQDTERLALAMAGHKYVIHAAALKFIPEGEFNASEVVNVNIDGARSVIAAARLSGVMRVVGISTDKAAQPVNIYGMTKAVMERLFAEALVPRWMGAYPVFTTCRYGNVIGSTGSVVPAMIEQYHHDGRVRITHPSMTRFWMSVNNAVDTILLAFEAEPGVVVVPAPKAASMIQVAHAVLNHVKANGPDDELIETIGRRPGEKMHETLITDYEKLRTRDAITHLEIWPPGTEDYNTGHIYHVASDDAEQVPVDILEHWIADAVTV